MKLLRVLCVLLLLVSCTGCIPILIHSAVESNALEKSAYSAYLDSVRASNTQRQIAGLPLDPVLTREEWKVTIGAKPYVPLRSPADTR